MRKSDLLKSALEIVEKRGLSYGRPENNFDRIADLWGVYLQQREAKDFTDISPTDVAAMMALMKIARLMEKPDHLDSWLDLAGYAACGAEVSKAGEDEPKLAGLSSKEIFDIVSSTVGAVRAEPHEAGDPGLRDRGLPDGWHVGAELRMKDHHDTTAIISCLGNGAPGLRLKGALSTVPITDMAVLPRYWEKIPQRPTGIHGKIVTE